MSRFCCGSSSIQRQKILKDLGLKVELCLPSRINETAAIGDATDPEEIVKRITRAKTDECLKQLHNHRNSVDFLVTGDIVVLDNEDNILGKPKSVEEAAEWFRRYNAQRVFYTIQALEITNLKTGKRALGTDWVTGKFKSEFPIDSPAFRQYLESSGAMRAAGAMIVENEFFDPHVAWIRGEIESVRGLSVKLLKALLFDASDCFSAKPSGN